MFPSQKCLEKLKCSYCNQLLSVFPVYIKKNDPKSSICGRCELPNDHDYVRCEIYENLAETVQFPCINKEHGCKEKILPEYMNQHEAICSYRCKTCIFQERNKCAWIGRFNGLFEHYRTDHKDLLLRNDQFEFHVFESRDFTNILLYNGEIFVFEYSYNHISKQLKCSISPLGLSGTITEYYGQIHLSTTMDGTISKNFPTNRSYPSKHMDINIENISNKNDDIIMGTIIIVDDERKLNYDKKLHQEIENVMTCFKCHRTLYDSVNNCENGHYTCSDCGNCCYPVARQDGAIEQFFTFIYRKCSHRGCNFIGNKRDFENHRLYCLFQPIDCCFRECRRRCQRRNFLGHIRTDHSNRIVEFDEIIQLKSDTETKNRSEVNNCLLFGDDLFIFRIKYRSPKVWFKIFRFNLLPRSQRVIYEFRILDADSFARIVRRVRVNIQESAAFYLHQDQLVDSIFDRTLSFKINVAKCIDEL